MPVEPTPLFRPDTLRPYIKGFQVGERAQTERARLQRWVKLFSTPEGLEYNESELLPDFLTDVFIEILGYTVPASGVESGRHTLSREKLVEVEGEFADAVIGDFREGEREFIAAVEGKGPRNPLDRPHGGRPMSAVDQCYRYAINLPCDWVIVTNLREIRLYSKATDQRTYESFRIRDLVENDAEFRKFVFLLGVERFAPEQGESHLYALRDASEKTGEEVTQGFYAEYAEIRLDLLDALRAGNPDMDPHDLLHASQLILDRVLFIAFCEDRELLPQETLKGAYEHRDPYHPRPVWKNFLSLFRAINEGNEVLSIPAYNGGLFAETPIIQGLEISNEVCHHFKRLGDYDYRRPAESAEDGENGGTLIDVEILGHIFEQSITDLEVLKAELSDDEEATPADRTRRQREGAFYTADFITRHIVSETLKPTLEERFERLRQQHQDEARGTAVRVLEEAHAYNIETLNNPQRDALIRLWEEWLDELKTVRVLDPACGSGAFLIEAFDQLHGEYQEATDRLSELRRGEWVGSLFDPDREILQNNLYGVDLNEEAVQICRLSIWIKTAQRGKVLTDLDHSIRVGNSIVTDAQLDSRAFDWETAFPEVFDQGGFDVVIGNPPYVRAEELTEIKEHLEENYETYHGSADLYVYFYELGIRLLRPGGRLSYVVTNKWLKTGYGKPLRKFFSEQADVEAIVDLGHAKQIFPDADVFPSVVRVRKPSSEDAESLTAVDVCVIPRDELEIRDLRAQIAATGFTMPRESLSDAPWTLERPGVRKLLQKMERTGTPLPEYMDSEPLYGVKTGFNKAFLLTAQERDQLVQEAASSEDVLVPFLRGKDINRWLARDEGRWMILLKSSGDHRWPWTGSGDEAESIFRRTYPAVHQHLKQYEEKLRSRYDQGAHWWELRSCSYYEEFEKPKLIHTDIMWRPEFAIAKESVYLLNTGYLWPTDDLYLLGVVNSPLMWLYSWKNATHGKDEALRILKSFLATVPIPDAEPAVREKIESLVESLINIKQKQEQVRAQVLEWLRVEFGIDKPGTQLEDLFGISWDDFISQIKTRREGNGTLSSAAIRAARKEFDEHVTSGSQRRVITGKMETDLGSLVNKAFGLTEEEVNLLWKAAPPRMPGNPLATIHE